MAWDRVRGKVVIHNVLNEMVFVHEYVMVAAILLAFRTRAISEYKTKSKKLASEIYLTTRARIDRCKNEDVWGGGIFFIRALAQINVPLIVPVAVERFGVHSVSTRDVDC